MECLSIPLVICRQINKTLILIPTLKRHQIELSSLAFSISSNLRGAILDLHAFTGSDTTRRLEEKRKVRTLKKNESIIDLFARLGTAKNMSTANQSKLEAFVCAYSSVNKLK